MHLALLAMLVAVTAVVDVESVALVCAVGVAAFVAMRFPLPVLLASLLFESTLRAFELTSVFSSEWLSLGSPVRVLDVLLVGMAVALLLRLASGVQLADRRVRRVVFAFGLFGTWTLFEAIRNFGTFGLASLGELRIRYLILVVPLYVMYYFTTASSLNRLVRSYVLISLFLTVLVAPLVIALRGGPGVLFSDRLFMPVASLGLVYGAVLVLAGGVSFKSWSRKTMAMAAVCLAGVLVFLDGRRAVWVALVLCVTVLVLVARRSASRWISVAVVAMSLVLVIGINASSLPSGGYFSSRLRAVTTPSEDSSAVWRASTWNAVIAASMERPVAGHGLGGYWDLYVPELDMRLVVQPHNAFVQMFYQLGAIGLGLYLGIIVTIFGLFWKRSIAAVAPSLTQVGALCRVSLAALIGAQAYSIAYSLDIQSLTIMGIGLAATSVLATDEEWRDGAPEGEGSYA